MVRPKAVGPFRGAAVLSIFGAVTVARPADLAREVAESGVALWRNGAGGLAGEEDHWDLLAEGVGVVAVDGCDVPFAGGAIERVVALLANL